jgi:hypothetical protein
LDLVFLAAGACDFFTAAGAAGDAALLPFSDTGAACFSLFMLTP